jgi:hypothetical protein
MRAWLSLRAAALPERTIRSSSERSAGVSVTRYFFGITGLLSREAGTLLISGVTNH